MRAVGVPLGTKPSDSEITQEARDPPGALEPAWQGNRKTMKGGGG